MLVTKGFEFDAAHNLINYKGKCEKLHGHTYKLEVTLEGIPSQNGLVVDFEEIKAVINEKVLSKLDHSYLNDLIKQPSAENIAIWVWEQLKGSFKAKLFEVKLYESGDSFVAYRG